MLKLKEILFVLLIFLCDFLFSQEKTELMKFGHIPPEDLLIPHYAPDTTADAVVLGDYGNIVVGLFESGHKVYFNRHRRIKLLKKSSFEREGSFSFTYISGNNIEKLSLLRAHVTHPDGKKQAFQLSDFIEEKINNFVTTRKIAFPNLEEGSIIEYEYEILTHNTFNLHNWYFQEEIPVRRSDLYFGCLNDYEYVVTKKGLATPKEDSLYQGKDAMFLGKKTPSFYLHYYMDSVEAIKSENFITTLKDYRNQIRFQLRSEQHFVFKDSVLTSWQEVADGLYLLKSVGEQYRKKENFSDVWKKVKPLLEGVIDDEEKIRRIYNFVNEKVDWDNTFSYSADEELNTVFKRKKGNSAEINLMILACLREAGLFAYPCLVSTVDHGKPITDYPIISQFNHLMCYVDLKGKPVYIDGGNKHRAYNQPRGIALNEKAFIAKKNNPQWLDIPKGISGEILSATFDLSEAGLLRGVFSSSYSGYAAVVERSDAEKDEKFEKIKKQWETQLPDITIDSITVQNEKDTELPYKRQIHCSINNAVVLSDDLMYVKPTLRTKYDENPFKLEKRNFPIDFPFQIKDNFVLNLIIPDGYEVEELPKNKVLNLGKDEGKFHYMSSVQNNKIQVVIKVQLSQIHYEVENYESVRTFFAQIATKCNEQIVLRKKKS